jgi:hypothetical protein
MDFNKKIIFLCTFSLLLTFGGEFTVPVYAKIGDFLAIDIKHLAKDDSFSIVSVDQVTEMAEDVAIRQSGKYKVSIVDSKENKNISSNYFSLTKDSFPDIVSAGDSVFDPTQGDVSKMEQEIILSLPLTQSIDLSYLMIKIEDTESGEILLEKQLRDTTFEVRGMNQFSVNLPPPPPVPIPSELAKTNTTFFSNYFWYLLGGGILLIIIITSGVFIYRRNKNKKIV